MDANTQGNSSGVVAEQELTPTSHNARGDDGDRSNAYHRHGSGDETRNDGDDDGANDSSGGKDNTFEMSFTELMYGASSYHAIAKPVSLTMILAACAAVFVNTEETIMMGEQQLAQAYQVWKVEDSEGDTSMTLARSFGNATVMVSVLCAMTFVIVLLYKYRCMKCLIGYMIFTSATLLGLMGSVMFDIAIDKYRIPIDVITYFFLLWNFAATGTVAIFWQMGVPSFITQGYLVATSVIMAWHLSHFDEWTAWTLLIMLALYDLCAVLTPCGPLKALVNAMQEEDAPEMPGLLYEAQLEGTPTEMPNTESRCSDNNGERRPASNSHASENSSDRRNASTLNQESGGTDPQHPCANSDRGANQSYNKIGSLDGASGSVDSPSSSVDSPREDHSPISQQRIINIPFAVAKIYRLPLVNPPSNLMPGSDRTSRGSRDRRFRKAGNVDPSSLLSESHDVEPTEQFLYGETYTPQQLMTEVQAQLPKNGGRIEKTSNANEGRRYMVYGRRGELKRVLELNREGKIFEVVDDDDNDSNNSDHEPAEKFRNSIRLGLGDFIFYSVMVAKAALYSFTTFAACMLAILAGLGVTLVLLAVYQHALPALPVSIFLGVTFYLLTRLCIEPWVQDVMKVPLYV